MKRLELWQRRSGPAAVPPPPRQSAAEAEQPEAELPEQETFPPHPADHEDTVPAAFFRSPG